jgi:hypothetical protein
MIGYESILLPAVEPTRIDAAYNLQIAPNRYDKTGRYAVNIAFRTVNT